MAELDMTFVRTPCRIPGTDDLMDPIFATFPLTVTTGASDAMLDHIGRESNDPIFLNNFEAVGFLMGLQKALAEDAYPAPGCAYLVEHQFDAMFDLTKEGCDLFIHSE